ncbi:hypothetical protein KFK09_014339 [Dendrobium nobile]|uniref:Uncharacterized protein n=1 Tax=Dendrobium nobile TaxID=94219 RepID=A0A8T3BBE8_DENNO|nr:hypothetical protein KFK09_014339 [Dendrobium nobile]
MRYFEEREISEEREREKEKEKSWFSETAERFSSDAAVGKSEDLVVRAREQEIGIDPDLQVRAREQEIEIDPDLQEGALNAFCPLVKMVRIRWRFKIKVAVNTKLHAFVVKILAESRRLPRVGGIYGQLGHPTTLLERTYIGGAKYGQETLTTVYLIQRSDGGPATSRPFVSNRGLKSLPSDLIPLRSNAGFDLVRWIKPAMIRRRGGLADVVK